MLAGTRWACGGALEGPALRGVGKGEQVGKQAIRGHPPQIPQASGHGTMCQHSDQPRRAVAEVGQLFSELPGEADAWVLLREKLKLQGRL